jgi:hypothetical protein
MRRLTFVSSSPFRSRRSMSSPCGGIGDMLVASHHTWSFAPGTAHMRGWCEPVRASPMRNCLIAQWATVSF